MTTYQSDTSMIHAPGWYQPESTDSLIKPDLKNAYDIWLAADQRQARHRKRFFFFRYDNQMITI